jgi:hypothetical protein
MAAFKTYKPDTSPGLSGWTHHLLATALRVPAFLKAMHTLTGLMVAGMATGQAMLCASRLTPLRKPDGGLPPIAVGDMIYRLATKAIIRHSNRRDFLLPYQFGVGSKGGVEPVVRAFERALDGTLDKPYNHLTSLDFSNAFNTVDRRRPPHCPVPSHQTHTTGTRRNRYFMHVGSVTSSLASPQAIITS